MSNFFCSLCNVNLVDENMLQIHLGTQSHQTMLRQQQQHHQQYQEQQQQQQHEGSAAGPMGPPIGGGASGGQQRSATHEFKYYCEKCDIRCQTDASYQNHLNGAKHAKKSKDSSDTGGAGVRTTAPAAQRMETGESAGSFGDQKHYCELCDIRCPNETMYDTHLKGIKHTKKVREIEYQRKKEAKDPDVYCRLCDITVHPDLMKSHLSGLKHLAALKAAGDPEAAALIESKKLKVAEVKTMKSVKQKGASSLAPMMPADSSYSNSALERMSKDELQKVVSKRMHMKCSVCDVPEFTSFSQAEQHFNSKAHRVAYQQHQQEMIKSKGRQCEVCGVIVSPDMYETHAQGYKHTLRLHGGQIPPEHAFYDKYRKHQETIRNRRVNKPPMGGPFGMQHGSQFHGGGDSM